VDALPQSDVTEPAPVPPSRAGERVLAGWFFGAAILIAILDIPIALWRTYRAPDPLVIVALVAASAAMLADFTLSRAEAPASRLSLVKRALDSEGWCAFAVGVMFLAFYGATIAPPTPYKEHARLAWALLHGHVWVNAPSYMEHVVVRGHSYLVQPAFDGILMLPAVAIWGRAANQTAVSVVLGAISIAMAWRLMGRLELGTTAKIWLIAFFGVGTTFWYEATLGASWDFALVASVPFTLAALCEVFGEARPIWVGLWATLAALARYDLVMAWPAYAVMLAVRGRRGRELAWMLPGFVLGAAVYVGYNEARFDTVNDIARWLWYAHDKYRFQRPGGPIALNHVPFNLYTLLFMAPAYSGNFPWIRPQFMGQALLLISPAFVLALRPSFAQPRAALVLLAALLTSGPSMLWYANGFAQLGPRYYVQVYPFLLALIAMGIGKNAKPDQLTKILIAVSIVFVVFFTWQARWYGWRT
jgi:hypothetical protein